MEISVSTQHVWLFASFLVALALALSAGMCFSKADKIIRDKEQGGDASYETIGAFFAISAIINLIAFIRILHHMVGEIVK